MFLSTINDVGINKTEIIPHLEIKSKETSTISSPNTPKSTTALEPKIDETSEVNILQIVPEVSQINPKIDSTKHYKNIFDYKDVHGDILNVNTNLVPTKRLYHTKENIHIKSLLNAPIENPELANNLTQENGGLKFDENIFKTHADDIAGSGAQTQTNWKMFQNKGTLVEEEQVDTLTPITSINSEHTRSQEKLESTTTSKFIKHVNVPNLTSSVTLSRLYDTTEETYSYNLGKKSAEISGYILDRTHEPMHSREPNVYEYTRHPWLFGSQKYGIRNITL